MVNGDNIVGFSKAFDNDRMRIYKLIFCMIKTQGPWVKLRRSTHAGELQGIQVAAAKVS